MAKHVMRVQVQDNRERSIQITVFKPDDMLGVAYSFESTDVTALANFVGGAVDLNTLALLKEQAELACLPLDLNLGSHRVLRDAIALIASVQSMFIYQTLFELTENGLVRAIVFEHYHGYSHVFDIICAETPEQQKAPVAYIASVIEEKLHTDKGIRFVDWQLAKCKLHGAKTFRAIAGKIVLALRNEVKAQHGVGV